MIKIKYGLLFFLVLAQQHAFAFVSPKALSCSVNGVNVYFFDGDLPFLSDNVNKVSLDYISRIVDIDKNLLDQHGNVKVFNLNLSNEDLLNTLYSRIKKIFNSEKHPLVEDKLAEFIFDQASFCKKDPSICKKIFDTKGDIETAARVAQWLSWGALIKNDMDAGKKVVIITFGYGNEIFNSLYALHPFAEVLGHPERKKLIAQLQVGHTFLLSSFPNKFTYKITEPGNVWSLGGLFSSTHKLHHRNGGPSDLFNNSFEKTYVSQLVQLERINRLSGRSNFANAETMFREALEETAWKLANNDSNCCSGKDGRFYRKDYISVPGGFIEESVLVDENVSLRVSTDSQVCGKVSFKASSIEKSYNEAIIENHSSFQGQSAIEIVGNVYLNHSFITNRSDALALQLSNHSTVFPLYFENSYIDGPSSIYGEVIIKDAYVEGVNELSGTAFLPPNQQLPHIPSIEGAGIYHGTLMNGFYSVGRNLEASVVEGKIKFLPDGSWRSTFVEPHASGLTNVSVIDHVSVSGQVDPNTYLEGSLIGNNVNGVIIGPGARIYGGSSIHGSVVLGPSQFRGYWNGGLNSNGDSGYLKSGFIINPPISYDPEPHYDNVVLGAPFIDGSEIYDTNISGTPAITGSKLNSCNVSCNAIITNETASGISFGCDYQSGQSLDVEYNRQLELNTERFELIKLRNQIKVQEVLQQLDAFRS